jgi:hypothetical protein
MRRLCSTQSKRRKKRIASVKQEGGDPVSAPDIESNAGKATLTAFARLTCLFARLRSARDQTAHPGSLLPSINRRCFNLWESGMGDRAALQGSQTAGERSIFDKAFMKRNSA